MAGAGPSGLYAADALARRGAQVDVLEAQFAPFGLVRYGVAPDHEKIKRTQRVFERTLARPEVRLFANVTLGRDVSLSELTELYDQVLIAVGSPDARRLGIRGEDLPGSTSATEFVNWYNGHPEQVGATFDLSAERAVVVGMGNVAVDVARILTRDPESLASTDIAEHALSALRTSRVREVVLLARRGPNQAKFDLKELRELAELPEVEVVVDGYASKRKTEKSDYIASFPRATSGSGREPGPTERTKKRVVLHFCASPRAILGEDRVRGVQIERNDLVETARSIKALGSGKLMEMEAQLVVRAIGYAGAALPGVPFCAETATIPNDDGRVLHEADGEVVPGVYVAGWIKRGPTGLIGTNKACANDTVEKMEADLDMIGPLRDSDAIIELLDQRGVRYLSYSDWMKLDAYETQLGEAKGKPREKLLSLDDARAILAAGLP